MHLHLTVLVDVEMTGYANATKTTRSQALIDSINELIALERDVSGAISSMTTAAADVMVPVTPVAFMPGTIAGGNVMVGLGQDYYVERTPHQAQDVLQRRITGARKTKLERSTGLCCHFPDVSYHMVAYIALEVYIPR